VVLSVRAYLQAGYDISDDGEVPSDEYCKKHDAYSDDRVNLCSVCSMMIMSEGERTNGRYSEWYWTVI
jgi:hypothetical protein